MKSVMAILTLLLASGCAMLQVDGEDVRSLAAVDARHSHPVGDDSAVGDDFAHGEYAGFPKEDDESPSE